ncbi:MAG: ABC transporter permease [Candidatus Methanomethylophilaceae archaeon]|nr:ABC transporter permease [Candidatus Methanomethylophilaceae archaeon]
MILWDIIDESYRVAWGDLCYIKGNLAETVLTGIVGPLLYLLAFGYGIGGSMGGGQDYIVFIVPGIIALTTLSATFSTVSMKILVQRLFYMSFDEMLLCPIHIASVVIGKTLSGVIRALISCTIIMLVGHLIAPDVSLSLWAFLLVIWASFMFSLLGLLAGMAVNKTNTLSLISSMAIVPMTFLCGTLFNVSALPGWAAAAIYVLPLTHVSQLSRAIMLDMAIPLDSIAMMVAYTAVFFALCWAMIKTNRC